MVICMHLPFLEPRSDIYFRMQMQLVRMYQEYFRGILRSTFGRDLSLDGILEIDLTRVAVCHIQLVRAEQL